METFFINSIFVYIVLYRLSVNEKTVLDIQVYEV